MTRRTITAAMALVLAGACTAGEGKAPASPAASPVEPAVIEGRLRSYDGGRVRMLVAESWRGGHRGLGAVARAGSP